MKRIIKWVVGLVVFGVALNFIVTSFVKSSRPPQVAEPPILPDTPVRIYGRVEPAGREVYVSPPVTKRVVSISVKEGDSVKKGEVLCVLESSVERAQYNLAVAKIDSFRKALAISEDSKKRKKNLYVQKTDSEYEYTQAMLQAEFDASNVDAAIKEAELARAQLEELELKSPIDGIVYKFDVRLGETLAAGDNTRIVLGSTELWVRLFVESFWLDRLHIGDQYKIYNSETNEHIGTGKVVETLPYVGRRDFRTEDSQERFDTKFQEVIVALEEVKGATPIWLPVMAELANNTPAPEQGNAS